MIKKVRYHLRMTKFYWVMGLTICAAGLMYTAPLLRELIN